MRLATQNVVFPLAALIALTATGTKAQTSNEPATAPAGSAVQEIVVTGSRIARRDYVADSPIVTEGQQAIQSVGSPTLETSLNQLPQVVTSASSSANFTARGGQASIDLRGLGQQRTLVLVDGRRMEPSGSDGSVDLNTIPTALIDSVEVITGGASAVYGSDAVTGVVNLKLKHNFSGAEVDAQYGITEHGDGQTEDVNMLLGGNFADDKGNAFISLDYSNRDPVAFTSRSYLINQSLTTRLPQGVVNVDATNLPSQAAFNAVFAKYGFAPGAVSRTTGLGFNTDGTLFNQAGGVNYRDGYNSEIENFNGSVYSVAGNTFLAQIPLTRYSAFGRSEYNLTPHIKLYGQFLYTNYSSYTQGPPVVAGGAPTPLLTIPVTNPFIPTDFRTILASRPNPNAPFTIDKEMNATGDRAERDEYNVYQLVVGAQGDVPRTDWTWNTYATYGRTDYNATELNYPSGSAINTLLSAPDGGASICAGGFNPFGLQPLSAACTAYINRDARNVTTLQQKVVEADLQGGLFNLPAGQLRFAAGADYRSESYNFTPDNLIASGDLANFLPIEASGGSTDVYELYGELLVPVFKQLLFTKALNLDLGYRFSDYDTVGGVNTYKVDFDWDFLPSIRLRGGYSKATRAPSVGELFAAEQFNQVSLGTAGPIGSGDPCDVNSAYRKGANAAQVTALCLAQGVPAALLSSYVNTLPRSNYVTAGNPDVKAETANTYSLGVVWRPRFDNALFSNVSLSVDYYNIDLKHAIGSVTSITAVQNCFDANNANPTYSQSNYYCGLVKRDPTTGLISQITNPELNLGGYKTDGVDIEGDWGFKLSAVGLADRFGALKFSADVNYLNSFRIETLPGGPFLDFAGTLGNTQIDPFADAHPRWKLTSSATYSVGPVETTLRWRFIDGMTNASNVGTSGTLPPIDSISYFDLDLVYHLTPKVDLRAGVANLLDQDPPQVNATPVGNYLTDPYTYDLIGRRFYMAIKARF